MLFVAASRYYKDQDELISAYEDLQNMEIDDEDASEEHINIGKTARLLAKITFFINLVCANGSTACNVLPYVILFRIFPLNAEVAPPEHFCKLPSLGYGEGCT